MIVKKQIIKEEDTKVTFYGITLLSREEYLEHADLISNLAEWWWWLRSPGGLRYTAKRVDFDGSLDTNFVYSVGGGVRPVLIGNFKSSNLECGAKFKLAGHTWTVLNDEMALCDECVGRTCFRKDEQAPDANNYDTSDIKAWLYNWAEENMIYFTMQAFDLD